MHHRFVPRGEPCVFVVLKSSIFWTDAKKGGGTAMFVDGGAIACCICCISGSFGLISPIHGQLPCHLTNTQLHQLHPCQTTRGWHCGGLHRSMLALAETLLCRLSMGKYMHKVPVSINSVRRWKQEISEALQVCLARAVGSTRGWH